jgi:hypothetical protein
MTRQSDQPGSTDPGLDAVVEWLLQQAGDPPEFFGRIIRQSIDEVLDGPRTGRWSFDQLEKTEKTYVGTKLEIVLRIALELQHAGLMDLEIVGEPVDIKWAMASGWQIPREAVGELCLCVGGLAKLTHFQVGVVRCLLEHLNAGENRDGKKTLSTVGRGAMQMLVHSTPLPPNFVAEMDPELRESIMSERHIQQRVTRLFRSLPGVPIPRDAVRTIARTEGDPMRRLRADSHADDPLEGMKVLSATYANTIVEALGYPRLGKDEFMAVPVYELDRLPPRP